VSQVNAVATAADNDDDNNNNNNDITIRIYNVDLMIFIQCIVQKFCVVLDLLNMKTVLRKLVCIL